MLPIGESDDFEGVEAGIPIICLGPFLKLEVLGREVLLDFLIPKGLLVLFHNGFFNAYNWNIGENIYYFPLTSKEINIDQWFKRLSSYLEEKSSSHSRVCVALLACWNSTLNCFLLPEGPLTVTLEDVFFNG